MPQVSPMPGGVSEGEQPVASTTTPRDVEAQEVHSEHKEAGAISLPRSKSKAKQEAAESRIDVKAFFRREWAIFLGMLKSSYLNWLLILSPIAIILGFAKPASADVAIFVLNFFALVPLALLLGDVTEHLAERYGDVVGGLLNATFGNVVEIVLALQALRKGQYELVEMSLIGSVLSNLLLVLSCCFLIGGYYHHIQEFTIDTNMAQMALLFFAVMCLCFPTSVQYVIPDINTDTAIARVSHCTAVLMFFSYLFYLYFQLRTHPELCDEEDEDEEEEEGDAEGEGEEEDLLPKDEKLKPIDEEAGKEHANASALQSIPSGVAVNGGMADVGGKRTQQISGRTQSGRRTTSGRPLEVVRTASGRMVEMVRTNSGKLVEVSNKIHPESSAATVASGSSDRVKTLSGRSMSGRNSAHGSLRGAGGNLSMRVPVNDAGVPMTEQEIVDLNRARRMSGRPPLGKEAVVAARKARASSDGADPEAPAIVEAEVAEEEVEEEILSTPFALIVLSAISVLVALHCEFLTEVIQTFSADTGLSQPFIAMIVLPIAGNACEHLSAVFMAAKNRFNLSLGIAVGSALQISLLAMPFVCLIGWFIGKPFLLSIDVFALFSTIMSVIITYIVIAFGKCNWVYGVGPLVLYLLVAVVYFYRDAPVDF